MFTLVGQFAMALVHSCFAPLTLGKYVWHLFTAGCQRFPMLRSAGHTGLRVAHIVADGVVQSALERMFRQRR
eukprot:6131242-Lingulodinium_polyedra.AAC.1